MNADEEREKLLWQVVFEREYCRNWFKTPKQVSGQPAGSLNGTLRNAAKVAGAPNRKQEDTWQRKN